MRRSLAAARIPVSSFGLVPQNYYWAWSLAAFVSIVPRRRGVLAAGASSVPPRRARPPGAGRCSVAPWSAVTAVAVWPRYPVASVADDEVEAQRVGRPLRAQLAAAIDAGVVDDHVEVDLSRAFFANDHPYVMLAELQRAGIEFHFVPDSRNLDRFGESRCAEAGRYQRLLLISGPNPQLAPGSVVVAEVAGITDRTSSPSTRRCSSASATSSATRQPSTIDGAPSTALDEPAMLDELRGGACARRASPADGLARHLDTLAEIRLRLDPGSRNGTPSIAGSSSSCVRPPTTRRSSWNNPVRPTIAAADIVSDRDVARQQAISPPRVIPGTVTTTPFAPRSELIRGLC